MSSYVFRYGTIARSASLDNDQEALNLGRKLAATKGMTVNVFHLEQGTRFEIGSVRCPNPRRVDL